jgi:hypothetical protein
MPIRSFKAIPRDLVEWGRFFAATPVVPDPDSVGNGTIQDLAVTYAKIQNVTTDRLLGRDTSPAGQVQEIVVSGGLEFTGSGGIQRSALTGDVTATAGSNATTIANNAVTDAKFRTSAATSIVGRSAGTTGNVADIAAGSDGHYLRRASGALSFGAIADADIPSTIARDTEVTAAISALNLASGTYTPTLTGVANIDATTAYACQYLRVGSVVTVSGRLDADATAAALTSIGISLPIASNLASSNECAGTAFCSELAAQGAAIFADAANNRAQMQWVAVDITSRPMFFSFTYQII